MPPGHHIGKPDNYYEPYWKNGDWVFYRNSSTRAPTGYILNTGSTKHAECDQICIELYEEYGPVCGMRLYLYNDLDAGYHHAEQFQYVYKSFKNMCYLELANCIEKKKRFGKYPRTPNTHHKCIILFLIQMFTVVLDLLIFSFILTTIYKNTLD